MELKFRMWNDTTKRFEQIQNHFSFWNDGVLEGIQEFLSFQQFTGLLDKNGKEIFEGDILRMEVIFGNGIMRGRQIIKTLISFQRGAFWFDGDGHTDCNWHFYNESDREVIGNIFEHPELLKENQ